VGHPTRRRRCVGVVLAVAPDLRAATRCSHRISLAGHRACDQGSRALRGAARDDATYTRFDPCELPVRTDVRHDVVHLRSRVASATPLQGARL